MSISCVTFDLDDTLWAVGPVIAQAEREFYAWLQANCPDVTERFSHDALVAHRHAFFIDFPDERHDLTGLRKRWLVHVLNEHGYTREVAEAAFRVFWEHRNAVTLFDDAQPTLDDLKGRYRMGVITNGNACVEFIGIDHYFDFVVSSERAGKAKPAPDIFHIALEEAGSDPEAVVHVGDDPRNDVLGAQAVGMRTVWFNPSLEPWPGGQTPDAVIRSLSELKRTLDRLAAR